MTLDLTGIVINTNADLQYVVVHHNPCIMMRQLCHLNSFGHCQSIGNGHIRFTCFVHQPDEIFWFAVIFRNRLQVYLNVYCFSQITMAEQNRISLGGYFGGIFFQFVLILSPKEKTAFFLSFSKRWQAVGIGNRKILRTCKWAACFTPRVNKQLNYSVRTVEWHLNHAAPFAEDPKGPP